MIIPFKAGKLAYQKYDADGKLESTIHTTGLTVQSIEPINISITSQDVADGNSVWPMAILDTEASAQVVVNFSDFSPKLMSDMLGGVHKRNQSNVVMFRIDEEYLVPDKSDYKVTLPLTPESEPEIVVTGLDASPWVKASSTPSSHEFSVSGSVLTFSSNDAGAEVFVTYAYKATSAEILGIPSEIHIPTVRLIITDEMLPSSQTGANYDLTFYIDRARIAGDIAAMTQSKTPGAWQLTWRVIKPRFGKNVGEMQVVRRS